MTNLSQKNNVLYLRCKCTSEVLCFDYDPELNIVDVSIYASYGCFKHYNSIWFKLKTIWNILKTGRVYSDYILLDTDNLAKLKKFIDKIL